MDLKTLTHIFTLVIVQSILKTTDGRSTNTTYRGNYTYLDNLHRYYKIHTDQKTWPEAKRVCELEGATLFYPENEKEATELIDLWIRTQPQFYWIYIGISDLLAEGGFKTMQGRPVAEVYHNWDFGEPNNRDGNEDCVIMMYNGRLNDVRCNNVFPFVCKKAVKDLQPHQKPKKDNQQITKFFRKDYTFLNPTMSFYKIHRDDVDVHTWQEAKKQCELEGATLFYAENEYEAKEVMEFLKKHEQNVEYIYIGISDLRVKGYYETIDERPLADVYHKWAPGEPNNYGGKENCLVMLKDTQINDGNCDDGKFTYICKRAYEDIPWDDQCNMPRILGYVYNFYLGSCYKFHTESKNWIEAFKVCRDEKSYLAVIGSQVEADYLVELSSRSKNDDADKDKVAEVHLGFHNRFGDGWTTVKGNSLEEAGYSTWGYNNPDGGDSEQCGSMFFDQSDQDNNGKLNDLDCDQRTFYICEHEVNSTNDIDNRLYRL